MAFKTIAQLTAAIAGSFTSGSTKWTGQGMEDLLKDVVDSMPVVNGKSLGMVADGTTNNSAVLTSLLATYDTIYVPPGNYFFSAAVTLADGKAIIGSGYLTKFIWNTNDTLLNLGRSCKVEDIRFNRASGGGSSQRFIKWDDKYTVMVDGCWFENSQGAGISFTGLDDLTRFTDGSHIQNCFFIGNERGIYSENRGEYVNIVNCSMSRNTTGVELDGGNVSIIGCNVNQNDTGIRITGGDNNGHCVVSGTKINHNTHAIYMTSVNNGHRFDGCDIYAGTIQVISCAKVSFNGCDFSDNAITITESPDTSFIDARYIQNMVWTVDDSYLVQLYMDRTFTPSGTSDTHGRTGDVARDDSYLYVKTSAGWKRAALSTF